MQILHSGFKFCHIFIHLFGNTNLLLTFFFQGRYGTINTIKKALETC